MKHARSIVLVLLSAVCLAHVLRYHPTATLSDSVVHQTTGCRSRRQHDLQPNSNVSRTSAKGIVLFYHIAKTGGTTIRRNFARAGNVHYVLAKGIPEKQIDAVFTHKRRKRVLFVEFHKDSPGLPQLDRYVHEWRLRSQQLQIPFFAFTLLRDPVSLHVSAYTFFHHKGTSSGRSDSQLIVESAVPNRQCRVLFHGQGGTANLPDVTADNCRQVQQHLCSNWDWVGSTESLNSSTFPMLYIRIHREPWSQQHVVVSANVQHKNYSFSKQTRQKLERLSRLDRELYNAFRETDFDWQ